MSQLHPLLYDLPARSPQTAALREQFDRRARELLDTWERQRNAPLWMERIGNAVACVAALTMTSGQGWRSAEWGIEEGRGMLLELCEP